MTTTSKEPRVDVPQRFAKEIPWITQDEKGHARFGWIEYVIQTLIVISLFAFAAETLPNLPSDQRTALRLFEVASIAVFTWVPPRSARKSEIAKGN